jgi:hypothetical protein
MKKILSKLLAFVALTGVVTPAAATDSIADPLTSSWLTTYFGRYARIVETDAQLADGTSETT